MRGHLATGGTLKHSGGLQRPVLEAKNGTDQSALGRTYFLRSGLGDCRWAQREKAPRARQL